MAAPIRSRRQIQEQKYAGDLKKPKANGEIYLEWTVWKPSLAETSCGYLLWITTTSLLL
jgi:hypothetical protein